MNGRTSTILTGMHVILPDGTLIEHTGGEWRSKLRSDGEAWISFLRAVVVFVQGHPGQHLANRHSICICGMD